jgi:competence protein ComEC
MLALNKYYKYPEKSTKIYRQNKIGGMNLNLKTNKLLQKRWVQVLIYVFLVIIIGSIYDRAAGWFIMTTSVGLAAYNYFMNDKFKKRKLIYKVGISFLIFFMFFFGIGLSNPLTPEQKLSFDQQKNEKVATQKQTEQDKINKNNTEAAKSGEENQKVQDNSAAPITEDAKSTEIASNAAVNGQLKVHFIDVGQADSILVQQGNSNMLIDAGNNGDAEGIKSYLERQGVKSIDVVVGTHAHEDHIGSLDYIINSIKVGKVYFPKQTATTKTFQDFASSVKSKGLQLTTPLVGTSFNIGDATATILAPNGTSYEDANDYSIVIRLTYGNTSFLLTGDAEAVSESEMLSKGLDLSATVLKVGHHGSRSSTSQSFLNKVNPKYAVISVGKGNTYGHPTQEVMDRLKAKNIPAYRTDENGTIVATSNGNNVSFSVGPGSYSGIKSTTSSSIPTSSNTAVNTTNNNTSATPQPAPTPVPVQTAPSSGGPQYVDANGQGLIKGNADSMIYHLPGGASYGKTKAEAWFKTEAEAQAAGYRRAQR